MLNRKARRRARSYARSRTGHATLSLLVAILFVGGCTDSPSPLETAIDPAETAAANEIVDGMIAVYQNAGTYRDKGSIEWDVHRRGRGSRHRRYNYSLEFARPNRLRLSFEPSGGAAVDIISDGFKIHAAPKSFFNQVVQFDAPEKIEVPDFYETESLKDMLRPTVACSLVSGSLRRFASLPLDLLAGSEPLKELRTSDKTPTLADPQMIGDERCDGVRYSVAQDSITLWISQESRLLRRVQITPASQSSNSQVRERLSISFSDAEIDVPEDPRRFHWDRGADDIYVRELVSPTGAFHAASAMQGQQIPNYEFFRGDGTPADMMSMRGKVVVIDLWATYCPPCAMALPKLAEVHRQFKGDDRVEFLALNMDDPNQKTLKDVGKKLEEWGADLPFGQLIQVNAQTVYQQLQLDGIPATIILSPSGEIQVAEVGFRRDMTETLPVLIENLLSYEQRLGAARIEDASQSVPLPQVSIATASQPSRWNLTSLWSNSQLVGAGNLLVVEEPDKPSRIFVIDGPRSVAELGHDGKVITRHKDIVPEGVAISMLRTGKTKEGERLFVAAGIGQAQVFVFDEDWQLRFAYPSEAGVAKVYDVTVGRFVNDGMLNIVVGYFGPAGVHALSSNGDRLWRNRFVENVGDMAIVPAQGERAGFVLCANQLGTLLPIDEDGKLQSAWQYRDRAVPYLAVAPSGFTKAGGSNICAITVDVYGNRVAAGLDEAGGVQWSYILPAGEYQSTVDPIVSARFDDNGDGEASEYWVIAASDGTVHWLRTDGENEDHFATGQEITGIAATQIGGDRVLLISGRQGVTAWALAPKAAAPKDVGAKD